MSNTQDILAKVPDGKRLYEESPAFREAVDDMMECFDSAREMLSDEDYAEYLRHTLALWRAETV